jgi:hypothetical protein
VLLLLLLLPCCYTSLAADNVAQNEAIVPLLLARCHSLLVQLASFHKPDILDILASTGPGKARLHKFVATACSLAQRFLRPAPFPEQGEEEPVGNITRRHNPMSSEYHAMCDHYQ